MFSNIKADIARLDSGKISLRTLVRGLLSQGFQAILVYRFFRWLWVKGIPAQLPDNTVVHSPICAINLKEK